MLALSETRFAYRQRRKESTRSERPEMSRCFYVQPLVPASRPTPVPAGALPQRQRAETTPRHRAARTGRPAESVGEILAWLVGLGTPATSTADEPTHSALKDIAFWFVRVPTPNPFINVAVMSWVVFFIIKGLTGRNYDAYVASTVFSTLFLVALLWASPRTANL